MADKDPEQRNPLSPYFSSRIPSVPTEGRKWVAILLFLLVFSGIAYSLISSFISIF
jgi:hypothetical protein